MSCTNYCETRWRRFQIPLAVSPNFETSKCSNDIQRPIELGEGMDSSNGGRREPNKSSPTNCCFETLSQTGRQLFPSLPLSATSDQGIKNQHEAFHRRILSFVPRSISCGCLCTTLCRNKVRCRDRRGEMGLGRHFFGFSYHSLTSLLSLPLIAR